MAYERLDEALRQLKTDRERAEATENQQKKAGAEAIIRFARIKSAVIGPIFDEVIARLAAEGFFGETVDKQNDASGPISLNVNLSEDDGLSRQGTLQVRFNSDEHTCEFGKSTAADNASTIQIVFDDKHHKFEEMTEDLVREIAEQFVLDLIAGPNRSSSRPEPSSNPASSSGEAVSSRSPLRPRNGACIKLDQG